MFLPAVLLSRRLHLEECSGIMVIFQILESEQSLQSLLILITPSRTELLKKVISYPRQQYPFSRRNLKISTITTI